MTARIARSRPVTKPPQSSQSAARKPRKGRTTATTVMRRSSLEAWGCGCVCESVISRRMLAILWFASPDAARFAILLSPSYRLAYDTHPSVRSRTTAVKARVARDDANRVTSVPPAPTPPLDLPEGFRLEQHLRSSEPGLVLTAAGELDIATAPELRALAPRRRRRAATGRRSHVSSPSSTPSPSPSSCTPAASSATPRGCASWCRPAPTRTSCSRSPGCRTRSTSSPRATTPWRTSPPSSGAPLSGCRAR